VRAGTGFSEASYNAEISLTGRAWEEFDGNNFASLGSAASAAIATISDKTDRAFGDVSASANVFETNGGLSCFLDVGVKFGYHFTGESVTGGLRYHW
jgi:hypothetical protein